MRFHLLLLGSALLVSALTAQGATAPAAADEAIRALIYGVPKTELHIHFEGTLEPEQYLELVKRNHLTSPYPTAEAVKERLRHGMNLPTFIEVYEELLHSIQTSQDFHDVAMAYFTKARSQGVVYVEMFFDPQMHTTRGIPLATVMEGLGAARLEARQKLGLRAEYIMCFNRDRSAESAMQILEQSPPYFDRIVGIGLDNPEELNFPQKFQAVYARARQLGLRLTSHCDVNQVNTNAHHWGVINLLGVERIDHGVNLLDDPKLITAVRDRHIGVTVCPTLLYADIPGRLELRVGAIKRMLDLGLLVTVNSDDPGMLRGNYAGDVLRMTQETARLTRAEILTLVRNGFQIAWLSDADRRGYLAAVDAFAAGQTVSGASK